MFEIKGKVALVTGGASGIGICFVKELLRNEAKGVTIVDVDPKNGENTLKEIKKEFGSERAIFVLADVSNHSRFEDAFKRTIHKFNNLDILINNAGILNDSIWEREIAININGLVHGMLLGLEHYIPKYRSSNEGVIINLSSIAGIEPFYTFPVYTGTKFAIFGMSKAWGDEIQYNRTGIKVITLCPGGTVTDLFTTLSDKKLLPGYESLLAKAKNTPLQPPDYVATSAMKLISEAKTGTAWVIEGAKDPYEFILPSRENFSPS